MTGTDFSLDREMQAIQRVLTADASDAVAFYGARIVEATAAETVSATGGDPSPNLYSNLVDLAPLNLLDRATLMWGHTLRRLGNDVRHAKRSITQEEAEIVLALLDGWISGYAHSRSILKGNLDSFEPLRSGPAADRSTQPFMDFILAFLEETHNSPPVDLPNQLRNLPFAACVAGETFINRNQHNLAREVIDGAMEVAPDDLRLTQLKALYHSRRGDLSEAVGWIQKALDLNPDDQETLGISGGIQKRIWQAEPNNRKALAEALRAYRHGWRLSKRTNTYLGINVASVSLLSDEPDIAREIAGQVASLMEAVEKRIRTWIDAEAQLGIWDQFTLAEAKLVSGNLDDATRIYQKTRSAFPNEIDAVNVADAQAKLICTKLGISPITFVQSQG